MNFACGYRATRVAITAKTEALVGRSRAFVKDSQHSVRQFGLDNTPPAQRMLTMAPKIEDFFGELENRNWLRRFVANSGFWGPNKVWAI